MLAKLIVKMYDPKKKTEMPYQQTINHTSRII